MKFTHEIFGYVVASDIPLRVPESTVEKADIFIREGKVEEFENDHLFPFLKIRVTDENTLISIDSIARFKVENGKNITFERAGGEDSDIIPFILGTVMGALMTQNGEMLLHGSAVTKGDSCVLFIAPSGVGKSTTAAKYLSEGYQLLSDDVCRVVKKEGNYWCFPSYPQQKLSPASLDEIGVDHADRPFVRKGVAKKLISHDDQFCHSPKKIKAMCFLMEDSINGLAIKWIEGHNKFQLFKNLTYGISYIQGNQMKAEHFKRISGLINDMPLARCTFRKDNFQGLDEMFDALQRFGLS